MKINEEDEDFQNKTIGSEIEGVLKLNSGDLIERSIVELPLTDLFEEWHLKKLTLI